MDLDSLPPQLRSVLGALTHAVQSREPSIRAKVEELQSKHPNYTNHQLALALIRSTRRRVAATGALSGAVSIAPGLGTVLAIGTITSQTLYALEQEVELVMGIAIGRVGCFLTGLPDHTYGVHSSLPWAVDFGDGPRHPTQLYEIAFVMLLGAAIFARSRGEYWNGEL